MSKLENTNISILGAGTMGKGIAHSFAQFGYSVRLYDSDPAVLATALDSIAVNLDRQITKGILQSYDKETILCRITPTERLEKALESADLVIEAVLEDIEVKQLLWKTVEPLVTPNTLLASNTSSVPISDLASVLLYPERFIGMHFMNPVPVLPLVEIIVGKATDSTTLNAIIRYTEALQKTPIVVQDAPGFISNRILLPMINEAVWALQEGIATADSIDQIMQLGMRHPMGPLRLADHIGLDVCLHILRVLERGFSNPKYHPCPLLVEMVQQGKWGIKSKQGFYSYH
ncbi:MAG: 3-hydroxyacyl-CoA dehydrogenase NAD-binding domain-containing protein [Cytophagaceae bacterium]|nr:3-hydroxyacyl-CoA dehydrogenase NAD-binding domain-containing protein [Cytophagaceae bacterium]